MATGLQRESPRNVRQRGLGVVVVAIAGVLLLLRAFPLVRAYTAKLSGRHATLVIASAALAGLAVLLLLSFVIVRRPRLAAATLGAAALAMTILSGNSVAALAAGAIFALSALLGDAVFRLLGGRDAGDGDLHAIVATGAVAAGTAIVVLDLAGLLGRAALALAAAGIVIVRGRRVPAILGLARRAFRGGLPGGAAPTGLEATWLALASLFLLATWVGALSPDVSWDGLAHHLPQARDVALTGHIRALPDLAPQSLLWRSHDAFLSLPFFFSGGDADRVVPGGDADRIVQLLQFALGLSVFGAALALARRIGASGAGPLVVLGLAAFPTAMLQLRSAYVDWPAALPVTAAAALLAARGSGASRLEERDDPSPSPSPSPMPMSDAGRFRLAGFLFAGAIAIKVFAVFAGPALLILALRRLRGARKAPLLAAAFGALIPIAPWLVWSHARAGTIVAPYAASPAELVSRLSSGHFFTRSATTGQAREAASVSSLFRLPYDLVFHSSRFEPNGDGYNGLLVLLLLLGLAGWDWRRNLLFLAASAPFVVPWSFLFHPSMRFLIPVFPLYVVYTAEGLSRWTKGFSGATGRAAGIAALAVAAAFPVHFGSTGIEWKAAFGLARRSDVVAARLPSATFARRLRSEDRVVLVGENDRFHIPAGVVWRSDYFPVAAWGWDPDAWRRGLDAFGITAVVWRSDRDPLPVLDRLGDRLSLVEQNGPSRLYAVVRP